MDWNNDGKKDIVTGGSYDDGRIRIYLNTGTDPAPAFSGYTFLQVGGVDWRPGVRSMPDIVDWDNDNLIDVLCGEEATGRVHLAINSGSISNPVFTTSTFIENSGTTLSLGGNWRSAPVVTDWDRDGNKDLIIGHYFGRLRFYRNVGTDDAPLFTGYTILQADGSNLDAGYFSRPDVADWNGDGIDDIIVGNDDGEVWLFRAIHPSLPYLVLESDSLSDDDGDGFLERGESASIVCTLRNDSAAGTNVEAVLNTDSSWCTVTTGSWSLATIGTGATADNAGDPFRIQVHADAPPGQTITFQLDISANGGAVTERYKFAYSVAKPNLSLTAIFVNDSQGDTNCVLNAGESAYIVARILNQSYPADNVTCRLSASSSLITVNRSEVNLGTVGENESTHNGAIPFSIAVSTSAPPAAVYEFYLEVFYDTCVQTSTYAFLVGDYVVDDTVPYSWVDTSGATVLPLATLNYVAVPLPFTFTLYGKPYTTAYVTANGQVLFEDPDGWYYYNVPIPDPDLPNTMVAPYWDILDPNNGGVVRHQAFGSAPNRYWVVEWNSVPYYFDVADTATFQAILHENGRMVYQYGSLGGGVYANGASATVGIEGPSGVFAEQYSYNTADSVMNGDAVEIRISDTVVDTDLDGLPDGYELMFLGGLGATPDGDADGDGRTNEEELHCLTNPDDSNSVLRIEQADCASNDHVIRWQCVAGAPYNVRGCSDLAGSWSNLNAEPIVGPGSCVGAYTSAVPSARCFYRIVVP